MQLRTLKSRLKYRTGMSAAKILVLILAKTTDDMHAEIQAAKIQAERILRARERVSRLENQTLQLFLAIGKLFISTIP